MPNFTIQGHQFEVPEVVTARFVVGYTLQDEGEAHALRQAALNNIRQTCNNRAKKALNGGTTLDLDKMQSELAAYAESYKFGDRAKRGPRGVDPVEREMTKLAREDIVAAFFAKHGEKLKGEQLAEATDKLLVAKGDDYARRARRVVADREKAGMDTLAAIGY